MNLNLVSDILLKHHENRSAEESPYPDYLRIVAARDEVIDRFRSEFIEPEELSESTFRDFLAFKHNKHWTGLQRPSNRSCDDMPRLRRALTYLFDEDAEVAERLDALTKRSDLSVAGLNMGILTPLLLVRYPNKYGVWNKKSEAALKALKVWPRFDRGTSKGQQYAVLNDLFLELSNRLRIDLWCLDGLWHVIHQKNKHNTDDAFLQTELQEKEYFEGRRASTLGQRIERNVQARNKCIAVRGLDCVVCGFNFFVRYGELGLGYIHVHHIEDLAHSSGGQQVDPKRDLVPVCPNCHMMLHKGVKKARSVKELKRLIRPPACDVTLGAEGCTLTARLNTGSKGVP